MKTVQLASAAIALLVIGCTTDLTVPPGARVSCTDTSECPTGFRCQIETGICVSGDVVTPALDSFLIERLESDGSWIEESVGTASSTFRVTLVADGPLALPPEVTLDLRGRLKTIGVTQEEPEANRFVYEYPVVGDCETTMNEDCEPEGTAVIFVNLTSESGGVARGLQVGSLLLDFTPPEVVSGSVNLTLTPDPSNPLDEVTSLRPDTELSLLFAVSEDLASGEPTEVVLLPGDIVLPRDTTLTVNNLFRYESIASALAAGEGTFQVEVRMTDVAGNTARQQLSNLDVVFDSTPPGSPNTVGDRQIVYHRAPWGVSESGGESRFQLTFGPGAHDGLAFQANAYDSEDIATAELIGESAATGAQSFETMNLTRADRVDVFVVAIDDAGNVSDASGSQSGIQGARVLDVVLTAALGGKEPGSVLSNPNRYETRNHELLSLRGTPLGLEVFEAAGAGLMADGDGSSLTTQAGLGWRAYPRNPGPQADSNGKMAFNTAQRRVVYFGGANVGTTTWEWDGSRWESFDTILPTRRLRHAMAYDAARDEVVLFGGEHTGGDCAEGSGDECSATWVWNGTTWRIAEGRGPAERVDHVMASDPLRGGVILFGGSRLSISDDCGEGTGYICGDTWHWDGENWTNLQISGPGARTGAAATDDRRNGRVLLFGGQPQAGGEGCNDFTTNECSDLWAYDGAGWTRLNFGEINARVFAALAYDEARDVAVLTGGRRSNGFGCDGGGGLECIATWEWDGAMWNNVADNTVADALGRTIGTRPLSSMVFDGDRVMLMSGTNTSGTNDIDGPWFWDGVEWSRGLLGDAPVARQHHAMAYDDNSDSVIMYGGYASADGTECSGTAENYCGYTWQLKAGTWRVVSTGLTNRRGHVMVGAPKLGVLLFGGENQDSGNCEGSGTDFCRLTWLWNGSTWVLRGITTPPPRADAAMAYDPVREVAVMFGGYNGGLLADTWEWGDSTGWNDVTSAGPVARENHAMAYDPNSGDVLLFGGTAADCGEGSGPYCDDTWAWNGTGWTTLATSGPRGRFGHSMVYHPDRGKVVMWGGVNDNVSGCGEGDGDFCVWLWEWSGSGWRKAEYVAPWGREEAAMAYDEARGELIIHGGWRNFGMTCGETSGTFCDYVWSGYTGGAQRAQHVMFAPFVATDVGLDTIQIREISTRWFAGSNSFVGGVLSGGVQLSLWSNGSWLPIGAHSSSGLDWAQWTTATDPLWQALSPGDFNTRAIGLFTGDAEELAVAVEPASPGGYGPVPSLQNDTEYGDLTVDYADITIEFRQ